MITLRISKVDGKPLDSIVRIPRGQTRALRVEFYDAFASEPSQFAAGTTITFQSFVPGDLVNAIQGSAVTAWGSSEDGLAYEANYPAGAAHLGSYQHLVLFGRFRWQEPGESLITGSMFHFRFDGQPVDSKAPIDWRDVKNVPEVFPPQDWVTFSTRVDMNANLGYTAGARAWVMNDSTAGNNGMYVKLGALGAGSWQAASDDVYRRVTLMELSRGAVDGLATLDSNQRLKASQLPAGITLSGTYRGGLDGGAVPNTAPAAGDWYFITAAGTSQGITWAKGDKAIYEGTSGNWTQIGLESGDIAIHASSKAGLEAVDASNLANGVVARSRGYSANGDGGGGDWWLDTSGSLGAAAQNGIDILAATGGVNRYWRRIWTEGPVPIEWAGGKADGITDNTPALQALLAWGGQTVYVVFGRGGGLANANISSATTPYLFISTVTLPTSKLITIDGLDRAVFKFDPVASRDVLFEIQGGVGDRSGIILQNFKANCRNQGILLGSLDVPARLRWIICQNLYVTSGYYAIDLRLGYTFNPVFRDIILEGGGNGLRVRPDSSSYHVTSQMTVDRVHVTNGTGAFRRGARMWFQGCQGLSITDCILEGTGQFAEDAELVHGQKVIDLFIRNGGLRAILIKGCWSETPPGSRDSDAFDVYIRSELGGSPKDTHVDISGALTMVDKFKLQNTGPDGSALKVILRNCGKLTDVSAWEISDGCILEIENGEVTPGSTTHPSYVHPRIVAQGLTHFTPTENELTHIDQPAHLIYEYTGGWLDNDMAKFSNSNTAQKRYVQHDPYIGPTLLIDQNANGNMAFPHRCIIESDNIVGEAFQASFTMRTFGGGPNYHQLQTSTGFAQMRGVYNFARREVWHRAIIQAVMPAAGMNGTMRLPKLTWSGNGLWTQYAAIAFYSGRGPVTGRSQQMCRRFLCYEDPAFHGPALGTVLEGDAVLSRNYAGESEYVDRWLCTQSGTSRPIAAVTCDTTSGSTALANIANPYQLVPGDFISIAGVTGTKRVMTIDYPAATAVIDSNADATVSGADVAAVAPIWEALWNGRMQIGGGSPVGSVTPQARGQEYYATGASILWKAIGPLNTSWVQIG